MGDHRHSEWGVGWWGYLSEVPNEFGVLLLGLEVWGWSSPLGDMSLEGVGVE